VIACADGKKKKKTASLAYSYNIIPVEWPYIFNILFAVKLNEDVGGGGIAVIAWTSSDEYV